MTYRTKNVREAEIEKAFTAKVRAAGGEIRKVKWIGRRGAPDRVVMLNGTWWIEFKAPGERPTAQQMAEHRRMRRMGQTVIVIDSICDLPHTMLDTWA